MRLGELQTAYATQLNHLGKAGDWIVYNEDKEELWRFPAHWDEKTVMAAIKLGREFEMKAFNRGVNFQKSKNPQAMKDLQKLVANNQEERQAIINRNEVLANEIQNLNEQLDRLTIKQ